MNFTNNTLQILNQLKILTSESIENVCKNSNIIAQSISISEIEGCNILVEGVNNITNLNLKVHSGCNINNYSEELKNKILEYLNVSLVKTVENTTEVNNILDYFTNNFGKYMECIVNNLSSQNINISNLKIENCSKFDWLNIKDINQLVSTNIVNICTEDIDKLFLEYDKKTYWTANNFYMEALGGIENTPSSNIAVYITSIVLFTISLLIFVILISILLYKCYKNISSENIKKSDKFIKTVKCVVNKN